MKVLFISIDRMPFPSPTLDNGDPLFALVIGPYFYLHHIEVADQGPVIDSLQAEHCIKTSIIVLRVVFKQAVHSICL